MAVYIKQNKGAIILEYVLLLVACLGFAMIIKETVELQGNVGDSGWIIQTWMDIIKIIAEDV